MPPRSGRQSPWAKPWPASPGTLPRPGRRRPTNSPPPRRSYARSWRRLEPTSPACAGLRDRAAAARLRRGAAPRRTRRRQDRAPRAVRPRPAPDPAVLQGRAQRPRCTVAIPYGSTELCPAPVAAGRRRHRRAGVPADLDPAARPQRAEHPPCPLIPAAGNLNSRRSTNGRKSWTILLPAPQCLPKPCRQAASSASVICAPELRDHALTRLEV